MDRAFLITDLSRPSSQKLLEELAGSFDVERVDPVYLSSESLRDPAVIDSDAFLSRITRPALLGEVGCALAHRQVYETIANENLSWAAVFEDDIDVASGPRLAARLREVIASCDPNTPTVFIFGSGGLGVFRHMKAGPVPGSHRPAIQPYSTYGYALNSAAARLLAALQHPVSSTADWPSRPGDIEFLLDGSSTVVRTSSAPSSIDPAGVRRRTPLNIRLQLWTTLWYWRHRDHFSSLAEYSVTMLKPRAYVKLYRIAARLWPVSQTGDL